MFPKEDYPWSPNLAFVLFSIDIFLMLFSCLVIPFYKIAIQEHSFSDMNSTWLISVIPAVVVSGAGSVVSQVLDVERARVVLILSYIIWGIGVPISLCIIAFYYSKSAIYKLPPPELLISIFLPMGPLGNGSFAITNLGISAEKLFNSNDREFVPVPMMGEVAQAGGSLIGLVLWGFAVFWLSLATSCVVYGFFKYKVKFGIGWWSVTFPIGTLILSSNEFARLFQNSGFRIFGAIMTVVLLIIWIFLFSRTIVGAYTTEMFYDPSLDSIAEVMDESSSEMGTLPHFTE
ncbi:Sulfite efflux pump SSU1 [Smittium mucronatum]|uniref:Sulfite efflux pump SSU1 n=1 Tax=Smittium mucronatum TaxID=133383 RepID=A0A1R0H456_9FUNG|nr:Sulfite efflux pump SSU1 [Smittium mucronatum]